MQGKDREPERNAYGEKERRKTKVENEQSSGFAIQGRVILNFYLKNNWCDIKPVWYHYFPLEHVSFLIIIRLFNCIWVKKELTFWAIFSYPNYKMPWDIYIFVCFRKTNWIIKLIQIWLFEFGIFGVCQISIKFALISIKRLAKIYLFF